MSRLRPKLKKLAILAGVAVTACGEQPNALEPVVEPGIEAQQPVFNEVPGEVPVLPLAIRQPWTWSRSNTVGPAGGSVQLGLLRLDIPAGALDRETEITMTVPSGDYVQVKFEPHGLQFKKPATLSVALLGTIASRFPGLLDNLQGVYFEGDDASDGSVRPLEQFNVRVNGHRLQFNIRHFSGYCVGTGRCDTRCAD